jgi:two-component system response regulator ResD
MSYDVRTPSRRGSADDGPEPRYAPPGERSRQLVLLAEDDPHDLDIYGRTLWYNGFDVLEAADGERALELARLHKPDLVLVDLLLPGLTGIEVCRRIREDGLASPVIALTARAREDFGDIAREAGCIDYLEKPVGPLDVLRTVERVIGRPPPPGDDAG